MSPFVLGFLAGVSFLTVIMIMGIIASLYTAVLDEKSPEERKKYTFWAFLKEMRAVIKASREEEKEQRRLAKARRKAQKNAKKK